MIFARILKRKTYGVWTLFKYCQLIFRLQFHAGTYVYKSFFYVTSLNPYLWCGDSVSKWTVRLFLVEYLKSSNAFGFALLHSFIGIENLFHFLNKSVTTQKTKPLALAEQFVFFDQGFSHDSLWIFTSFFVPLFQVILEIIFISDTNRHTFFKKLWKCIIRRISYW